MQFLNSRKTSIILTIFFYLLLIQITNNMVFAGTKTITLSYSETDIKFFKQNDFDIVSLPQFDFIIDSLKIGEPMMPVKTIRILLPTGTEINSISVNSVKEEKIEGTYNIYPIQHPCYTGEKQQRNFINPKKGIYESSEKYPGKTVEFKYENYFREFHIVEILIYPIQFKPAQKELILYKRIDFEIEFSPSSKFELPPRLRQNEKKREEIKEKLKNLIFNPDDISLYHSNKGILKSSSNKILSEPLVITSHPSATEGQNVEYIIITDDALVQSFQRLADYKTKKGIVSIIKTISWISENYSGCDIQEKIRHFIQDAYLKWGADYILLGGDTEIIPGRIDDTQLYDPITDLYYSAIYPTDNNWNSNGDHKFGDGADYYADIWVGRAPVHNVDEVNLFIDKVFTYERNSLAPDLPSQAYLTKMLSLAGVVHFQGWNWNCGIYAKEQVNNNLTIPSSLTNWKMYEYESTYGGYYSYDEMLNKNNAINRINEGYSIINHIDHSSHSAMAMGSKTYGGTLSIYDVDNLTNGNKYSVVYSAGCGPNAFDYDCIAEHFILNENGGAVAFVGPSRSILTSFGNNHDYEFFESLFNSNNYNIGQTLAFAWYSNYTACIYNLLGDPEMPIWTDIPQNLAVSHPSSVTNGEMTFDVVISNLPTNQDALVCLQKDDEDYAFQTVTGTGSPVIASFTFTPDTPGDLNVTVTSHNFIPYEATVPVSITSIAHLHVVSITIDDDQTGESTGNGDGIIDAGETIELPITLKNSGSIAANDVTATLAAYERGTTNPHPHITITDGSENFGNIPAGASVSCTDDFGFTVLIGCPDEELVEFILSICDENSNTWEDKFYLEIGAPEVQHTAHIVSGDLEAGASIGLIVEISNYGNSVAKEVTATLSSSDPYIDSITDNFEQFGDINPNSTVSSQDDFNFTIGSLYNGYDDLNFILTIQDEYGKVWTHNFELTKPNVPNILDFTGYETSIDVIWEPNTDSDLKGYNLYRSDTPTGAYEKVNDQLIEGTSYFQDTGLQIEKIYYYKVAAVDESANESNMSDYIKTWTTIKYLSGWPIKINGRVVWSSPTLFDVDNDGDMEIFIADEAGYVYAWHHNGEELYDIDNNPTTVSGFAFESGANFYGTPAVGDLDGDGIFELVIAAGGNNNLYCWHIDDSNSDGSPDLYWTVDLGDHSLCSPAIGDLDNDGYKEIVIQSNDGNVHIYNYNGSTFDGDPWASMSGSTWSFSTPSLVDLDHDGDLEIILGGKDGKVYCWRYTGNNFSSNWPFDTGVEVESSPAVGDIDNDGEYEIVIIAADYSGLANPITSAKMYVKDIYGNDKSGWSGGKSLPDLGYITMSSPSLGNIDDDTELEIIMSTKTTVEAFNHDGTIVNGWPISGFSGRSSSPMIADIDGQWGNEIIIGSDDGNLYAFYDDGTPVDGWPCRTGDYVESSPAIADVNGDGDYEIVVGSLDSYVYLWDIDGIFQRDWPMFHSDAANIGVYHLESKQTFSDVNITDNTSNIVVNPGEDNCIIHVYSQNNGQEYDEIVYNQSYYTFNTSIRPLYIVIAKNGFEPYQSVTGGAFTSAETWFGNMNVLSGCSFTSDASLTILPGTKVLMDGYFNLAFLDNARLIAEGTEEAPIVFTSSNGTSPQSWKYLYIRTSNNVLRHCEVKYGNWAIFMIGYPSSGNVVENCTIHDNDQGIRMENNEVDITNCDIYDNRHNMVTMYNAEIDIEGTHIHDGGRDGIYCYSADLLNIYGSVIEDNGNGGTSTRNGIYSRYADVINIGKLSYPAWSGYNTIRNNYNNEVYSYYGNSQVEIRYNSIHDDSGYEVYNYSSNPGIVAMYCWWGEYPPDISQFYGDVLVIKNMSSQPSWEGQTRSGGLSKAAIPVTVNNESPEERIAKLKNQITSNYRSNNADTALTELFKLIRSDYVDNHYRERENFYSFLLQVYNKAKNYPAGKRALQYMILWKILENDKKSAIYLSQQGLIILDEPDQMGVMGNLVYLYAYTNQFEQAHQLLKRYTDQYKFDNDGIEFLTESVKAIEEMYEEEKRLAKDNTPPEDENITTVIPDKFALEPAYPNPFNATTVISYQLPEESRVKICIYNINGQLVQTLVNDRQTAGYYSVNWNSAGLASGIYLYQIVAGDFQKVRKCMVIK